MYNQEDYLRECLDSITQQIGDSRSSTVEVLCIDDGCTDGSVLILQEYVESFDYVRVLSQCNQGVSSARNRGLDYARGEWIMFVDPDDVVGQGTVEVVEQVAQDKNDIIYFGFDRFIGSVNSQGRPRATGDTRLADLSDVLPELRCAALAGINVVNGRCIAVNSPWAKLYRRDFLAREGLRFVEEQIHAQDVYFNVRCLDVARRVAYIDRVALHYRVNPNSVSNRYRPDVLEHSVLLLNSFAVMLPSLRDQERDWRLGYATRAAFEFSRCMRSCPLHPHNPHSYSTRKDEFRAIASAPQFRQLLKDPALWRLATRRQIIFLACARLNVFILVNVAYRSRRNGRRSVRSIISALAEPLSGAGR